MSFCDGSERPTASDDPMGGAFATRRTTAMPESDFTLGELTPKHFSFNSHLGACPACHGLGTQLVCDPELMISDPREIARGRRDHAVAARDEADAGLLPTIARRARETFSCRRRNAVRGSAGEFKKALYFGTGDQPIEMSFGGNGRATKTARPFEGLGAANAAALRGNRKRIYPQSHPRIHDRVPCKTCGGARLKPEILAVTIKDRRRGAS